MLNLLRERLRQGHRTLSAVDASLRLPEQFRGRPRVAPERCSPGCADCTESCPTDALALAPLRVDLGACLFCGQCERACPQGALVFANDHRMATRNREALIAGGGEPEPAAALEAEMLALFGRSLKLRQVSAGGCNGCEAELVASGNVVFDMARFGVQFVASPRHADGIVITGPVTVNMRSALYETYEAIPDPKLLIAVGACAISGGAFAGASACTGGVPSDLPVDLYIPGCPPHPLTVIDGLRRLLARLR